MFSKNMKQHRAYALEIVTFPNKAK